MTALLFLRNYGPSEVVFAERFSRALGQEHVLLAVPDKFAAKASEDGWPGVISVATPPQAASPGHEILHALKAALAAQPGTGALLFCRDDVHIPDIPGLAAALAHYADRALIAGGVEQRASEHDEDASTRATKPLALAHFPAAGLARAVASLDTGMDMAGSDSVQALLSTILADSGLGDFFELLPEFFDRSSFQSRSIHLLDSQATVGQKVLCPALTIRQITSQIGQMGEKKRQRLASRLASARNHLSPQQNLVIDVALACRGEGKARVPTTRRPILRANGVATAMANRHTLHSGPRRAGQSRIADFDTLHLDHFDPKRQEAVWVRTPALKDPREGAFYYQSIRQHAAEAIDVPYRHLAPWEGTLPAIPIFVFSIGRCGSTLFSQISKAAGLPTWSEPDSFTNLVRMTEIRRNEQLRHKLARVALNDLARKVRNEGGPDYFAVKLRSHVSFICTQLAAQHADSKSYFLVRDPVPWAKSFGTHFGSNPATLANRLDRMIRTMRHARDGGMDLRLLDYAEMLEQPERICKELAELTGRSFDPAHLGTVMAADSQAGTTISRGTGRVLADDFVSVFTAELERLNPELLSVPPAGWLGEAGDRPLPTA
ncbi:hypothetical protein [Paracoccus ravus]|uniref:hypothetical protein n=1 Tax=Paracoccus ravus TaxID=2447760 RepID=UPI00106E93B1|nr:hypothetical protein [Paracoccus ravus]